MKKKMRKYADGGVTEGQNPRIDDDTRTRAMKFVEDASEESRDIGAPVTRSASKTSSKVSQTSAPAKPKADEPSEKKRIENINKKQALENVSPELDFMPAGKLAVGAGALYAGAKAIGKRILANREKSAAKNVARKSEEGFSPKEALDAKSKNKAETNKMRDKAYEDVGSGMFKRGGSVSSASKRADGCAVRGKTRA
jgi:hypothetical protein